MSNHYTTQSDASHGYFKHPARIRGGERDDTQQCPQGFWHSLIQPFNKKAFALAAHLVFLHGIGVSEFLAGMLDTSFYIRLLFHCMAFGSLAK